MSQEQVEKYHNRCGYKCTVDLFDPEASFDICDLKKGQIDFIQNEIKSEYLLNDLIWLRCPHLN